MSIENETTLSKCVIDKKNLTESKGAELNKGSLRKWNASSCVSLNTVRVLILLRKSWICGGGMNGTLKKEAQLIEQTAALMMCIRWRVFFGRVRRFLKGLPPFEDSCTGTILFSLCGRYKQNLFTPRLLHLRAWLLPGTAEKHNEHHHVKKLYLFAAQRRKSSMDHTCVCTAPPLISQRLSFASLASCSPPTPTLGVYTSLSAKSALTAACV